MPKLSSTARFSTLGRASYPKRIPWLGLLCALLLFPALDAAELKPLSFVVRSRQMAEGGSQKVVQQQVDWKPSETAVLVIDVWDRHWCRSATERVGALAPRINQFLKVLRGQGALVIHCPSDTMAAYANTPQRVRAQEAPKAMGIAPWGRKPPPETQLPIDDSDEGCEDDPPCRQGRRWSREHPGIELAEPDAVTDKGGEVQNLLEQYRIKNVLVVGVHANKCLLNRTFSIPVLVQAGKHVALVRDLTDVMYNPRKRPKVDHARALDLVVGFIEAKWCPSLVSSELLGGEPFRLPR